MTTVFIAGSISISHLHKKVQERINKIVSADLNVVVGDADGADTSIQRCLHKYRADRVTVFCTGDEPRNNVAEWKIYRVHSKAKVGSRAYFTAKDLEMAQKSDYGLMVWDCKSTGTLSNVIELLKERKKSIVFINKNMNFVTVSNKTELDQLLAFMSDHARVEAEKRIGLSAKIADIEQKSMFFDVAADKDLASTIEVGSDDTKLAKDICDHTESMKLRFTLMSALKEHISRAHLSQLQAAKVFGVTQPRISDLTRGKVDLFGLDTLVNMAATAGLQVEMRVREVDS